MPAIGSLAGMEMETAGVGAGAVVEGGGVAGVCWDRRRRGRFNRRRRFPIEITNQAAFNDYITSLSISPSDDYSPVHFRSSVESWVVYSSNHTPSAPISEEVDLESGELETKVHSSENDGIRCRICHLKFEGGGDDEDDDDEAGGGGEDNGEAMELGCDCKGDLATAHQKCALTWFLIKGDLNCEICGSIVQNVGSLAQNVEFEPIEVVNNINGDDEVHEPPETSSIGEAENRSSMHGRRFVNVLLGCMAFAFVISWLFHFNMLH